MHRLAHMTVSRQFADLSLREEPSELRSDYAIFAKTKARKRKTDNAAPKKNYGF